MPYYSFVHVEVTDDFRVSAPEPRGRILLADDEPELLRAYRRSLEAIGYEVVTAPDGATAVEKFCQDSFNVVVTDISMPGMDGLQLLSKIREHDLDVPVILVTGEPSLETTIRALNYGALRYLVKPIHTPELRQVVEQAVNFHRMAQIKRRALEVLGDADRQVGDRAGLEVKFKSALEKIYMAYQPIVCWSTRTISGYEALVRSAEPTIPHPGALFDAAERLDRVAELSQLIRVLAPVPMIDQPHRGRMFFNLHIRDLDDPSLFDEKSPLSQISTRVVLEVTERASLRDVGSARAKVAQLRRMGFKIAVDDIGAGYAGLSSFAMLEPDVVKLDMALVRDIHISPTKQKLVRSMTQLCGDMGLEVVAEGVEVAEERDTLVDLGCDLLQGYLFAKPAPPFVDVKW